MGNEFTQDTVGNAGVERRLLQGLGFGRKIIVVVPVLATAQGHNLLFYLLLLLGCLFDGLGQFLQQAVALQEVLLGHGVGLFAACAVHLLQKFAHIEVVVLVGHQFLLVHAVGHQAVLAAYVAALDGVHLEGQRRAAAGVVVDFGFHGVGVAVLQVEHRLGNDGVLFQTFHEQFRSPDKSLQGFLGGINGDAELLQVLSINNLGLEVFQIVSVSLMLVEVAHFNGLFHVPIIFIFLL